MNAHDREIWNAARKRIADVVRAIPAAAVKKIHRRDPHVPFIMTMADVESLADEIEKIEPD